jgi:hypothetical protein
MSMLASPSATTLGGRWLLLARATWVSVVTLAPALFVASIPSYVFYLLTLGQAVFTLNLLGVLASVTAVLVCLSLAVVLFWRRSDDWMVMFISSYLLVYGTVLAGPLERAELFYPGWPSFAVDMVQPFFFTTPTIALFVLFPDGGFVPRWTRWLILISLPSSVAMIYQPPAYSWGLVGVVVIGAVYAQIYRYRYVSTPTGRQQTKWVLFGILLWVLLMGMLSVPYSLELSLPAGRPLPWWTLITSAVWWLALVIVPLSLSIAVLRYRLYDIDVFINRTLVYVSLTLMLALVYLGSVVTLQYAFRDITGQVEQPQLAIVVSTLVIAALFNPLRRRIQSFIDKRFYRSKYDARRTLEAFSAKLRDETDLEGLNGELVAVVRETMQPEHVSLWLRPETASRVRQAD